MASSSSSTTPRRIIYINTTNTNNNNPSPLHQHQHQHQIRSSFLTSCIHFLQKPHSLPFVLFIFLFFAWISYRIQRASHYPSPSSTLLPQSTTHDDLKANLVRFGSAIPSLISKDRRGWLLDPVSLALSSALPVLAVVSTIGCDLVAAG